MLLFSPPALAAEFHGYPCTKDCSGHKAGYEWAQKKGVTDPAQCGGNSNSFKEGCFAWAEDQQDTSNKNAAEKPSTERAPVSR